MDVRALQGLETQGGRIKWSKIKKKNMFRRGDGQCDCLVYCQKISEIPDSMPEKSDATNDQLIR